jgi:hypothetical protein
MFDEFDYSLDKKHDKSTKRKLKKLSLILSVILVFFLFFYIVSNAYKFITKKPSLEDITLVKAKTNQIKILSESKEKMKVNNIEMDVYSVLDKKEEEIKIKGAKNTKTSDKDLIEKLDLPRRNLRPSIKTTKKENGTEDKLNTNPKTQEIKTSYIRAQISALNSKEKAIKYWNERKNKFNDLFEDKKYFIEEADLGVKGKFYRLQVGNFNKVEDVRNFCDKYIKLTSNNKVDCIVINVK